MVDILDLLKKDFPDHTFEIKNEDGNSVLYADSDKVVVRWALMSDQDFTNQILVQSLEKELYSGIKNAVSKFLSGGKNV